MASAKGACSNGLVAETGGLNMSGRGLDLHEHGVMVKRSAYLGELETCTALLHGEHLVNGFSPQACEKMRKSG